ncbi:protein of unknown function [Burkholderia multivorans]
MLLLPAAILPGLTVSWSKHSPQQNRRPVEHMRAYMCDANLIRGFTYYSFSLCDLCLRLTYAVGERKWRTHTGRNGCRSSWR